MASAKELVKEMVKAMRGTGLRAADIAEGSIRFTSFETMNTPEWVERLGSKRLPANCKNCGAPLHGSRCEYCDTEY